MPQSCAQKRDNGFVSVVRVRPTDRSGRAGPARRVGRAGRAGLGLLGVLLAAVVAIVVLTVVQVWQVGHTDERPSSDAIVVLGAAQFDGRPSPVLQRRLDHAHALYRQGVAPAIVTVGGRQPGDRFTEAEAGARWLTDQGVPHGDVVEVRSGADTWQSMQDLAQVYLEQGWTSAVLVTDPAHSLRARTMARDLGIEAYASAAEVSPGEADIEELDAAGAEYVARETFALLLYRLAGDRDEA